MFHFKQFDIQQDHAAMKVGTDSDLLGTLGAGGQRILDVGTGTGVLSLMYAQRCPEAQITAIEIDDNAVIDASHNFTHSIFADRIQLIHTSFQEFVRSQQATDQPMRFDSVICNPPYFDKSLECDNLSKTRARHTSSLPFRDLIEGAYELLDDGGVFSVCIPPEVLSDFTSECIIDGFWLQAIYRIKSVPRKDPKRYVLVHRKGVVTDRVDETHTMRNADGSRSDWYLDLMKDFHTPCNPPEGDI